MLRSDGDDRRGVVYRASVTKRESAVRYFDEDVTQARAFGRVDNGGGVAAFTFGEDESKETFALKGHGFIFGRGGVYPRP